MSDNSENIFTLERSGDGYAALNQGGEIVATAPYLDQLVFSLPDEAKLKVNFPCFTNYKP